MADEATPQERANRELIELLNELRVALPGVQVLFAFLLAVPFQQRFHQATSFQRDAYFVTLSAALVSTTLLIAPSAFHRLNFRRHDKQQIVEFANRCVIAGMGVLAIAMVSVMVLISDVLFGGAVEISDAVRSTTPSVLGRVPAARALSIAATPRPMTTRSNVRAGHAPRAEKAAPVTSRG